MEIRSTKKKERKNERLKFENQTKKTQKETRKKTSIPHLKMFKMFPSLTTKAAPLSLDIVK